MRIVERDGITLKLPEIILNILTEYVQDNDIKPESGGIIMGYVLGGGSYVVTDVSLPSEGDKASRYRFLRSKKNAQRFVDKLFEKSKGKKVYLGEWHTHPEDYPTPSFLDKCSMKKQFKHNRLNSDRIFMLIIGRIKFGIWSVDKTGIKTIWSKDDNS